MEIATKYSPEEFENKWYAYWLENGFFSSTPDERTPYTIVIPPPNVTGVLHMGHMLNNTIQDVLIRRARLRGFNACWVPGTDHASIATEAKVVAKLKEEGILKSDLSREEFLSHAWEWTHQYGGIILEQLKKLGCSCDWNRTKFTMDDTLYASVIKSFVDLYNKGLIYRGYRMVNWDPEAQTTLSDEEVIYKEQNGKLYYLIYKVEGSDESLTVATTRPETIFGDVAVCLNPNDERYKHLHGKRVIVPVANRSVPIIFDDYVDITFGTGALKVTPAQDINDYEIGLRHNLPIFDTLTSDGKLNAYGMHYEGKDRFVVRKEIVKELEDKGLLAKVEDYVNNVGTSERTGAIVEQRPLDQWFLKMEELVKPALKAVLETQEIKLYPKKFENTYRHWLENVRDWNISRQLWWGHQIPAYYYGKDNDFVVAETKEKALVLAKEKSHNPNLTLEDLRQDEDALDTWFSSWLWPMSVFNGILEPQNEEFKYYYPTQDLVTGPDILFFWVARMIIAGYEFAGEKPFANVYLTGIVRDKLRRKMSKSLGNSPDALKLIKDFGADGVRVGLLLSSSAGNDLLFDEALCQQGSSFANKIWNAFRLVKGWQTSSEVSQPLYAQKAIAWYRAKFQKILAETEEDFEKYRISDALMKIYKLVWDDFCSWLLEIVKPSFGAPIDAQTYQEVVTFFEDNLKLLHPFMPFVTEEIWQQITQRSPKEALIVASYPQQTPFEEVILDEFEFVKEVISGIRTIRKEKNIPFKEETLLSVVDNECFNPQWDSIIAKLGNISSITRVEKSVEGALSFRVKANEYFIPIADKINVAEEIKKLETELHYLEGFLASVRRKLSNEKFVSSAPVQVVENERKKEADALAKIEVLQKNIKNLK